MKKIVILYVGMIAIAVITSIYFVNISKHDSTFWDSTYYQGKCYLKEVEVNCAWDNWSNETK